MTPGPPASRATLPASGAALPASGAALPAAGPASPAAARRCTERTGRAGLAASLASVVLTFAVAVAGPSATEPALPGAAGQPPWSLGLHLPAGLAIGLAAWGTMGRRVR